MSKEKSSSLGIGKLFSFGIIGLILYVGYNSTKTDNLIESESSNKIQISEEEIKEYVSMSGATQIITVVQDSTFVTSSHFIDNTVFGKRIQIFENKEINTLKETRVWKITAGIDGEITMRFATDTIFLQMQDAKILHIEELQNKYSVSQQGEWNAKSIHELATRSKEIANFSAIENGICNEAFANVSQFLAFKMPMQTVVNGMQIMQKNANGFSETKITVAK